jgi:2-keto-4-pentenoate hydratase/2-oxohepta-3-ene-1,7-dioic acid hydratase in catechol pathway
MNPRQFLRAGDVVRIEIEGIGHIQNQVIDEPPDTARI